MMEKPSLSSLLPSVPWPGLRFRAGVFDGAISISALQWLCSAIRSDLACSSSLQHAASSECETAHDCEDMAEHSANGSEKRARRATDPRPDSGQEDKEASMEESLPDGDRAASSGSSSFTPVSCEATAARLSVCNEKGNAPYRRLRRFFQWLFASIKTGGRAVSVA